MVPSVAWASRTVSAIVGMKRASTNSCHPHADGELVSVAIVRQQHAAGTQEAYRTAPLVDLRTQCTSLSAAIDKRRYGRLDRRVPVEPRCLQLSRARDSRHESEKSQATP